MIERKDLFTIPFYKKHIFPEVIRECITASNASSRMKKTFCVPRYFRDRTALTWFPMRKNCKGF